MTAAAIKPATTAERMAGLQQQMATLQTELWNDMLKRADEFERALSEVDTDGMPPGVRDLASKLSTKVADDIKTMALIMERRP